MSKNQTHNTFMQLALEQAHIAQTLGEVPVGGVLVIDNKVIAKAHNSPIMDNDPSAHAEINTLRMAAKKLSNYRLTNSTLYVTLEPCSMCFGAMIHARVANIVFGASDAKTGVCGGCIDLKQQPCFNHQLNITSGIMATECALLLTQFFKKKRLQKN